MSRVKSSFFLTPLHNEKSIGAFPVSLVVFFIIIIIYVQYLVLHSLFIYCSVGKTGGRIDCLKAYSHEHGIVNETIIGGVTLDSTVAANVSRLTFRQDQTLLDPNDNV